MEVVDLAGDIAACAARISACSFARSASSSVGSGMPRNCIDDALAATRITFTCEKPVKSWTFSLLLSNLPTP